MVKLFYNPAPRSTGSVFGPMGDLVREKTLGVVDIGSNTVHLLVARTNGRLIEPLVDISDGLRLGEDIDFTGALSDAKLEALITTLTQFQDAASAHDVSAMHLLATQAVRAASNRAAVLKCISERLGLEVEVLAPQQEAEYAFLGADLACPSVGPQVMLDIGGGSMQIAVGQNGEVWDSVSLPLGASRLANQRLLADPPTYLEEASLVVFLSETIRPVLPVPGTKVTGLLGVGGTLRRTPNLLGLQVGQLYPPNGIENMLALVRGRSTADIQATFEMKPERGRLLLPALLLLREVAHAYNNPPIIMSPYGVREGAILALARAH